MTDAVESPGGSAARKRDQRDSELAFRERELAVRAREQSHREAELALAQQAHAASRWKNPVVVAILAAAVAALGNAFVAYTNSVSETKLEAQKAEHARILEMVKTGSPDKAAENLQFLLQAGLLDDPTIRHRLSAYLDKRKPGTGPALPTASAGAKFVSTFEGKTLKPYKDALGNTVIGTNHILTPDELRSGRLMIGGKVVNFRSGITSDQANQLLDEDLEPIRKQIDKLVTVELTTNQRDALTSFAYNVGLGALRNSTLLQKLNAGDYEAVPKQLERWSSVGGRVLPGLVARRKSEIALWNKP